MKQYDHEPSISELFDQLAEEDAYLPEFLPKILSFPIIRSTVGKQVKAGMAGVLQQFMSF